jgi:hypothetical protein
VFPITPRVTPTPTIPRTTETIAPVIPQTTVTASLTVFPTTIPRTTETIAPVIPQTTVTASPTVFPTTIPRTTETITPVIPRTTVAASPTISPTTIPVTQVTTTPVVTVTVLVYRSGPVYQPVYYYSPGYPPSISYNYPTGTLTVTSNPSGAVVILDSYNSETTPYIFTGLATGYHTVEVDYPGYEAYINNVYIDDGAGVEVNADLIALDTFGSLFVDSNPEGADVYVDGNYQGISPVTVGALSAGTHQVELHLAGYEVLTSTEYVAAGEGTVVNLVLIPYSSSSAYGSIDITSTVPGALVYLDGIYKGSIQSGNTFNIISVDPGSHSLLLHLPGYSDFTQTVSVYAGQISDVNAVFSPSPANQGLATSSQAVGSVIVTSTPTGGQVYLNNQFRGVTPVTIYNVAQGTHIINLELPGYSDWSTSVDVPANEIVQVPATFIPSGTTPVPTRAGLSPVAVIGALALGAVVMSSRFRK